MMEIARATSSEPVIGLRSSRSIQEFRLDFLLEEEFGVDPDFAVHFLNACGMALCDIEITATVHSMSDSFGEADLVVLANTTDQQGAPSRLALLIENKINAGLQPEQGLRYRKRGDRGVIEGRWDSFITVLVAPQAYLDGKQDAGFMASVSVEQIKDWTTSSDPKRRAFKLARLDEVIAKKQASGVKVVDHDMTLFRRRYYDYLQDWNRLNGIFFEMRKPVDTWWDDSWFKMRTGDMPSWAEIRHLARPGRVCLDVRNAAYTAMLDLVPLLDADMKLVPMGKHKQSSSIEMRVPPIPHVDDFDRDVASVEAALRASERLLNFLRKHLREIEALYGKAAAG